LPARTLAAKELGKFAMSPCGTPDVETMRWRRPTHLQLPSDKLPRPS
jgi:hypothetical protein